jgi:hypothetical protein
MNWYAILTAVGIVVLLLGLAMSPTETQTTTTCVDSGYQYGSGCIDTTYEAPNPARGLFVGGGFFLALVAGSLWVKNRGITTKPRDDVGPVRQPQSSHTPQNGPSAGPDAGTDPTTADPDDDKPTTSADGEDLPPPQATLAQRARMLDSGTDHGTSQSVPASPESHSRSVDATATDSRSTGRLQRWVTRETAIVTASALGSAFVLATLLSPALTVASPLVRLVVFAVFALPGLALARRYVVDDESDQQGVAE